MAMKNPPHPGSSIKENCLDPLGLNVTEAAKVLGVARHTLSRVLNGHAGISPEMAIRLEKAGWSNAEFWLQRQGAYDLATGAQKRRSDQSRALPAAGSLIEKQAELSPLLSRLDSLLSSSSLSFSSELVNTAPEQCATTAASLIHHSERR